MSGSHENAGFASGADFSACLRQSQTYQAALGLAWATAQGGSSILGLLFERSPLEIWKASLADLVSWGVSHRAAAGFTELRGRFVLADLNAQMEAANVRFVPYFSSEYPAELLHLRHPPAGLFIKGPREIWEAFLGAVRITVVGTRKATSYGVQVTESFVRAFVEAGVTIVSGMALGIDGVAHRATLAAGGLTVAVLGSGIDVVYPRSNLRLYQRLAAEGTVISEFPPGMPPAQWTFPRRNRLLAALGDGVLVTEGSITSGALQTADWALELGRPVLAVPGSIMGQNHSGCNRLLYDGAIVALDPREAVEDFLLVSRMQRTGRGPLKWSRASASQGQCKIGAKATDNPVSAAGDDPESGMARILQALTDAPSSADALARRAGLSLRQVTAMLGYLEIEGAVARAGPGHYVRVLGHAKQG